MSASTIAKELFASAVTPPNVNHCFQKSISAARLGILLTNVGFDCVERRVASLIGLFPKTLFLGAGARPCPPKLPLAIAADFVQNQHDFRAMRGIFGSAARMSAIHTEQTALPSDRAIEAPVLRTLLICDLAESTAMVEKLGDVRAAELMRLHDRLSRDLLQLHGGREIDKTDGFLLLFERPIRAVAFALEYQRQIKDLGAARLIAMQARIGIHVGNIVLWDNNATDIARGAKLVEAEGLGKAVAARLMGIARPGQILLSGNAYNLALRACSELGASCVLRWRLHGNYRFKGVPEAVQVYEVGAEGEAPFKSPAWSGKAFREVPWWRRRTTLAFEAIAALLVITPSMFSLPRIVRPTAVNSDYPAITSAVQQKSIAVLPFLDMSEKQDQEYFSDGLSEELIDHLVHSADLRVISRTSSFQFKGRNEDVRSIGGKLGVTHLLEGSVRRSGQQLRITAQLIRATDGVQLWSQTYDRSLGDIFRLQESISDEVCQALRVALLSGHGPATPAPDIRAYNLVLEGNYYKARRNLADVEKAAQLYQQAIDIDPDYALAWARLASAYLSHEILTGGPQADQSTRVLDALDHATRLDPNLIWAYYTRGDFEMNISWNWGAVQADLQRMRDLDPRSDLLQSAFGDLAQLFGKVDRAVDFYREALERNPLDTESLDALGTALCAGNRLQQCLQTRLSLEQLHPEFGGISYSVGIARLLLGQFAMALSTIQREPDEDYRLRGLALVYSALQRRDESDSALAALQEKFASRDAYGIAEVHAYRGELDEAVSWLQRAYRQHDAQLLYLASDPLLQHLRRDAGFQALLRQLGLTGGLTLPEVRS